MNSSSVKTRMFVLYDGDCALCRRAMERLMKIDTLGRLAPLNGRDRVLLEQNGLGKLDATAVANDLHVVKDGKVWKGFSAYRAIASQLPLLWPVWPILWLWPVAAIGRVIYRRVATTRSLNPADWFTS